MEEDTIKFSEVKATYTSYTNKHHDKTTDEVSDEEHIVFLSLWLSRCIFCSRSLQVEKRFLTMANQLHVGRKLGLSQMILASLYESLGRLMDILRAYDVGTNILFAFPF